MTASLVLAGFIVGRSLEIKHIEKKKGCGVILHWTWVNFYKAPLLALFWVTGQN
jgi:hypothetical protein